jgi:hypothetical protein
MLVEKPLRPLQIGGAQPFGEGVTLVRPNGQSWMISDIYLDGAVSEVATRRIECAFHIRDGRHWTAECGIERKMELLRAAVVKSF